MTIQLKAWLWASCVSGKQGKHGMLHRSYVKRKNILAVIFFSLVLNFGRNLLDIYLYESMKKHNGKTCTYSSQKRNFFIKHVLNISCMLGAVLGQRFKDEYNIILRSKEFIVILKTEVVYRLPDIKGQKFLTKLYIFRHIIKVWWMKGLMPYLFLFSLILSFKVYVLFSMRVYVL